MNGHERMYYMPRNNPTEEDARWAAKMLKRLYGTLCDEKSIWERHPPSPAKTARMDTLGRALEMFEEVAE